MAALAPAQPAMACSSDDTAWVEGFLETTCLDNLSQTELDTLGGLRLQTNGAATSTTWTTNADFTTGISYQSKTFGPVGYSTLLASGSNLELAASAFPLTRDTTAGSVLAPTPSAAPDNDSVDDPTVVKDGSTYVMYYSGYAEDGTGPSIFRATSSNGRDWTKQDFDTGDGQNDLDPVVSGSNVAGAFDAHGTYGADVLYSASGSPKYTMYYTGRGEVFDRIGLATSSDGVTWQKYDDGDADTDADFVLDHGKAGARDSFAAAHPSVLKDGATWKMWYEGSDSNQKSIAYATSADGITWSKGGAVIEPGGGNVEFGAFAPTVWKTGATSYKMLLGTQKETGTGTGIFQTKIQEASSSDGIGWNVGNVAMNPGSSRFDAFDLNAPDILEDPGAGSAGFKLYYSGTRVDNGGKHSRIGLSQTSGGSGWQGGKFDGTGAFESVLDISTLTADEPFDARHASGVMGVDVPGADHVGVYWGTRGFDFKPRIGLVTSSNLATWAKVAGTQPDGSLLVPGEANSQDDEFDHAGQRDPSLLYAANANGVDDFHLYFTGTDAAGKPTIGYSSTEDPGTSLPDNTSWSNPGDNAMFSGGASALDDAGVEDPYVVQDGATYVMYYAGTASGVTRIFRATSVSPNTGFTAGAPVLDVGAVGSYDRSSLGDPVVIPDPVIANKWHLLYTAVETVDGRQIRRVAYATSTDDGASWAKAGVVLNPSGTPFATDESGVQPQGGLIDTAANSAHLSFDGIDRSGRARGRHATAATDPVSEVPAAGLIENGAAAYQLGDTTTTVRDWRTIAATSAGAGDKELWVSFLQPYSSAGKEYWSEFFPVDAIDQTAALDFLLTVKAVRWQARLADPAGTPAINDVTLQHANISFYSSGEGSTKEVKPPSGQTVTNWRTLTVTSDLFQPTGAGSGGGTVEVRDASGTNVLASAALNTNGDTTVDLSGIPAATNQSLRLRLALTSASPFTATPVVRSAKVLYFTNVSQPSVTLNASPTTVNSGEAVTLNGNVSRGGTPLAGETVTIAPGGATATTDASGNYSVVVNPTATTTYTATAAGATSPPVTVTVVVPAPPPSVTLTAAPAEVVFGQTVTLAGKATQGAAPLPNLTVQLLASGSPFATPTTNATGDYSATHVPQANTVYSASVAGAATNPTANVGVHQLVKLAAKRSRGNVVFSGSIAPAHPGKTVVIQQRKGTSFTTFVSAKTGSTSRFTARKKIKACGKFQFRAVTAADADHMDGTSAIALLEKHRVTLKTAVKGRTVTFTGKVAPVHRTGRVVVRELKGTRLVTLGRARLTRTSTFRFVKKLARGRHRLRVDMAADRCHFAGSSPVRTARLR